MSTIAAIKTLPGLVGYWPCDEATGTTVTDVTSTPANGSVSGSGAVLKPWNSPSGVGAVGLRPKTATLNSTAALTIPPTTKLNVGDNFSVGMFFRRRSAVTGSLYARDSYYGTQGSELLTNGTFEGASITPWGTVGSTVVLDTNISHGGSKSAQLRSRP